MQGLVIAPRLTFDMVVVVLLRRGRSPANQPRTSCQRANSIVSRPGGFARFVHHYHHSFNNAGGTPYIPMAEARGFTAEFGKSKSFPPTPSDPIPAWFGPEVSQDTAGPARKMKRPWLVGVDACGRGENMVDCHLCQGCASWSRPTDLTSSRKDLPHASRLVRRRGR